MNFEQKSETYDHLGGKIQANVWTGSVLDLQEEEQDGTCGWNPVSTQRLDHLGSSGQCKDWILFQLQTEAIGEL